MGDDKVLLEPPPPRANPLLLGHEEAEQRVGRWISGVALPHALLICGPWGIGKSTLAFRIARFLLRRAPTASGSRQPGRSYRPQDEELYSDSADKTFRLVASGTHPDLLTIERRFDDKRGRTQAGIIVEDVRRIGAFFSSSPAFGGWRVVVVDAADEMNSHAANALLKVLEEPNADCLLILLAHRLVLVPATIRSRCRGLLLQPLRDDVLQVLIARFLPHLPPEDSAILRELGSGSIGRVLSLAKHDALAVHRQFCHFFRALVKRDRKTLVAAAANMALGYDEEQSRVALHVLSCWLRQIARACLRGAPAAPASEEATAITGLASPHALDHWLKVWDKSHYLSAQADTGNLDRKQVLTTILLEAQLELRLGRF